MKRTSLISKVVLLAFLLIFMQDSLASYYPLSSKQCKAVVESIGDVLASDDGTSLYRGTFVSPRCELRRIQDNVGNGLKSAFLLRSIDIPKQTRRWTGNYYFYGDHDCIHATYGLKIQGKVHFKKKNVTFNINSLSLAVYNSQFEKEIEMKYNASCPGNLTKTESGNPVVYEMDKKDIANGECLKALGIGQREFTGGASFQTHFPSWGTSDELLQTDVRLQKNENKISTAYQWPLVRHVTGRCLTCSRITIARFKYPPKLSVRNATSLDGVWASIRCQKLDDSVWTTKLAKFSGNNFDLTSYNMDYTHSSESHRCHSPLLEIRVVGTYRRVGNSVAVPGGIIYEFFTNHAYITPRARVFEHVLNRIRDGTCGTKQWETGKTQDTISTGGCKFIGLDVPPKGTATQVLIRTVLDENRKELHLGFEGETKSGPLRYSDMTQSCSTYPVERTTTVRPTEDTTIPTQSTTEVEETVLTSEVKANILVKDLRDKKPTSSAVSICGLIQYILAFLFVYLLTEKQG